MNTRTKIDKKIAGVKR